jgi:propanol-preferring alcohol dehydrogenase
MTLPDTMLAAVLEAPGVPLAVRSMPVPRPGPGQLLVRLQACGVCHTDLHIWKSGGPAHRPHPLILGHEGVGEVVAIGEAVPGWRLGDPVGVPWLHDTCGHCAECRDGAESFCQAQRAHGCDVNGAFAEYVIADAAYAVCLPAGADPVATAPLMCAGVTAHGAVRRAALRPGSRCAIFGCGGLGLYAVQLAVRAGATVVALDVSPEKLDRARAFGAEHTVMVDEAAAARLQALGGMDACINFAPTDATWAAMVRGVRPRGMIVAAALVAKPVPVSQEWLTATGVTITGTSVGTRLEMEQLMQLHAAAPLRSATRAIGLRQINQGLRELQAGRIDGRLVIDFRL